MSLMSVRSTKLEWFRLKIKRINRIFYLECIIKGDLGENNKKSNGDLREKWVYINGDLRYTIFGEVILYG